MIIDTTSKLFILFAAYTLVHAAVYLWYQSKKQANDISRESSVKTSAAEKAPRRRVASGIHRSPSRHQTILLTTMLLATLILASLAAFSPGP
jgi:hypothetical protein